MKQNTKENREKLIVEIIDQMDLDALIDAVRDSLEAYYEPISDIDFDRTWTEVFGED